MIYRLGRYVSPLLDTDLSQVTAMSSSSEPTAPQTPLAVQVVSATPTVAALFRSENAVQAAAVSETADDEAEASATGADREPDQVSAIDRAQSSSTITATQTYSSSLAYDTSAYREVVIYADELDENWSLAQSNGVQYRPWDTSHWFQKLDGAGVLSSGATAIAVTPEQDYGRLILNVNDEATTQYRRDEVMGISFWLNSGDTLLEPSDLAVTIVGNDAQPFWTAPTDEDNASFSETRLYYLGVNRSIPPHTWVNIVVWLDKLLYDPSYTFVTGIVIKNDVAIRNTYYIDQISVLMTDSP
jgi:hypothetical protein